MEFWGDALRMPRPDEFIVKVVRTDGFMWEEYRTYHTMVDASECVDGMDKGRYRLIGIEPHCGDAGIFQTHALRVVWEAVR